MVDSSEIPSRWAMYGRLLRRFEHVFGAPAFFALVFQGVNGLLQISAFAFLHGRPYLDFTSNFLIGNILALIAGLNFENILLAGRTPRSLFHYFSTFWVVGLVSTAVGAALGLSTPSILSFCCWVLCVRLSLAWASSKRASPWSLMAAGLLVLASLLSRSPAIVLIVCFLALPAAAFPLTRIGYEADGGLKGEILGSAVAFAKYLPHTLSGFLIGYTDRYAALHFAGEATAEAYLRTVQMCSWSAFIIYPVVFQLRSAALKMGRITPKSLALIFGGTSVTLAAATGLVLLILTLLSRTPDMEYSALAIVFAAILCAQVYQVISPINFVNGRFSTVNRITLASAAAAVTLAGGAFLLHSTQLVLAIVLFAAWWIQVSATSVSLLRLADPAVATG